MTFPPLFQGVSTHKRDEGNAVLIEQFLVANWKRWGQADAKGQGGLFIDMQSVDDPQSGPAAHGARPST